MERIHVAGGFSPTTGIKSLQELYRLAEKTPSSGDSLNESLNRKFITQNGVLLTLMLRPSRAHPCAAAQQPRRYNLRLTFGLKIASFACNFLITLFDD